VTNITFIFETSPNTKPKEKKVGGHGILYPSPAKLGGHVPVSPTKLCPWQKVADPSLIQMAYHEQANRTKITFAQFYITARSRRWDENSSRKNKQKNTCQQPQLRRILLRKKHCFMPFFPFSTEIQLSKSCNLTSLLSGDKYCITGLLLDLRFVDNNNVKHCFICSCRNKQKHGKHLQSF